MIRCGLAWKSRSSLEAFRIRGPTQIMIMRNIQSFRRLKHYIVQLQYCRDDILWLSYDMLRHRTSF